MEAEWKLVRTPASGIVDIRERALIVRETFDRAKCDGWRTDNVHLHMLGALIDEIMSPVAED